MDDLLADDALAHIGTKRHSGRYPWGSGSNAEQRGKSFLGYVAELEAKGLSETKIAEGLGITTTQLRNRKSLGRLEKRAEMSSQALRLKDKGLSNVAIGQKMGINESSVRALLDPVLKERSEVIFNTSAMLKNAVEKGKYIDIGSGTENHLGIPKTKLNTAVSLLEEQGYKVCYVKVRQLGTGKFTSMKVLTKESVPYAELAKNKADIKMPFSHSPDGGKTFPDTLPITSISGSRVLIRYKEDGGADRDGTLELRRGVEDISLGNSKYAQVRVAVNGTHYMKGMAMYTDKMPKGYDIIYNTNKSRGTAPEKVFKPMEADKDNPFGATVSPRDYITSSGKRQRSLLNVVNSEGDWSQWSKSISSQVLSKQTPSLAKKQLDLARSLKKEEFDEIMQLTNPSVKKRMLQSFSDDCDSSAVHLKAAALPRQASHVILPITSLKENEIYAPGYKQGEIVALVRHPHGGTFEIPLLKVNNKNPEANSVMHDALDAVGIHPKVAGKLSGADFDGDTVLVIPNGKGEIKASPSILSLKDFNPKESYPGYPGMPKMKSKTKQTEMGKISNLITDMTIKGANQNEIARAVKHSMVVIDAEKHNLNYKLSAIENNISELKKKYQGGNTSGASTLISRASSEIRVAARKDNYKIDSQGRKIFENTNDTYVNSKGKTLLKTMSTTRMAEVADAHKLSSGTKIERIYADHANELKALANQARKEMLKVKPTPYSSSARSLYAKEVASIKEKLNIAIKNRPIERQAQLLANKIFAAKKEANPDMEPDQIKKAKGQALTAARLRVGAGKTSIVLTDSEWHAIQLGAISTSALDTIINNADLDSLKERAMPRTLRGMTTAKAARARSMSNDGYTRGEIASALGVSVSTLTNVLK